MRINSLFFHTSFLLSSSLLAFISPVYAAHTELEYATAYADTIKYVDEHQDAVWPGFQLTRHPTILWFYYDQDSSAYAFQFSPKDPNWKRLDINNMPVYHRNNSDFEGGDIFDQFFFSKVEDQLALVDKLYIPGSVETHLATRSLVKYLFQDYQTKGSHFPRSSIDSEAYTYDGANNIENIALSKLELASLYDYLNGNDNEALKNYLAVHQVRMKLLSEESVSFENALELSRGVPQYAATKSIQKSDADYIKQALTYFPSRDYDDCASLTKKDYIKTCLEKLHYNFIDLALGYALDKAAKPGWKEVVEKEGATFTSMLNKIYPMTESEIAQHVINTKKLYNYDEKFTAVKNTMSSYLEDMQRQLSAYQQLPGSEVSMEVTGCSSLLPSHADKYYTIDNKTDLVTNYKARYLCDGQQYRMNMTFDYVPFVFSREEHNDNHSIKDFSTVKMSNDTILIVDDKQETVGSFIKAGKIQTFHRLLIENNQILFRVNGLEGTLDGTNNRLKVSISNPDKNTKINLKETSIR